MLDAVNAQAIGRWVQIQVLKDAGFKQRKVAEKWGLGSLQSSDPGTNFGWASFLELNQGITVFLLQGLCLLLP